MSISNKKTILLIDDDEMVHQVVQHITQDKYILHTATSGDEGLMLMVEGVVPDLILLDIIMPGMDGWETYAKIRTVSLLHEVPIAFFTSEQKVDDIKKGLALGAVDYIIKPLPSSSLLKRIGDLLQHGKVYIY